MKYSILDVETTGFSPKQGDRIVELSLISINEQGEIIDTYETLINPKRDVGPSHIHGITPEMIYNAPAFQEIADNVIQIINEGIIIAHNAIFDLNFLKNELEKTNILFPELKGLCTLNLSKIVVPDLPSRKLEVLCHYFDIDFQNTHSAYFDCLATKDLFLNLHQLYVRKYGHEDFHERYYRQNLIEIPQLRSARDKIEFKRIHAIRQFEQEGNRLSQMALRLPDFYSESEVPVQEYLNILDEILADRIVAESEIGKLFDLAEEYHISKLDAKELHEEYLRRLVRVYLLDGTISETEKTDLAKVAKLLDLNEKLDFIIELESAEIPLVGKFTYAEQEMNYVGKSVCFTGEMTSKISGRTIDREYAQQLALEKGLVVKSGVSKKLDMLVVADPYTQSTKAKKARELNIPIIAEPVFWKMIGLNVE